MAAGPPVKSPRLVLVICYIGFISLGLPDTLIGVAWPSVRETFQLRQSDIAWIFAGSGCSYFISSFFAGRLLKLTNVGMLLAASSGLVALSGFDYALARAWPFFAAGSLLHGLGSGAIDSGLNHYVASHFSARQMNWLHACYSVGAMLGPLLMTAMIASAGSWRWGYMIVAITLLLLAALFLSTQSHWADNANAGSGDQAAPQLPSEEPAVTAGSALRQPLVWLLIFLFFVYTGLEVAIGQWSYTVLTETRGIEPKTAGFSVTIYWASILFGRIVFGFIVDRIGIDRILRLSTVTALAGTALFAWNPAPAAIPVSLALAGIGLAVIYPCLMTRTPQRLGKQTAAHAIGFQVAAAMLGAAALPSGTGFIPQYAGLPAVAIAILAAALVLFFLHEALLSSEREKQGRSTRP